MKDFRDLQVWQKGHQLVLAIYRETMRFPKEEQFSLITQIRRAAASIPANIAEGCGRQSDADFARFLQIAMGSASELEYHLLLAHDLGFLNDKRHQPLVDGLIEIKKMLATLILKLKADR